MTLTDTERSNLRIANWIAVIAILAFIAYLQITGHLPTGVLLP